METISAFYVLITLAMAKAVLRLHLINNSDKFAVPKFKNSLFVYIKVCYINFIDALFIKSKNLLAKGYGRVVILSANQLKVFRKPTGNHYNVREDYFLNIQNSVIKFYCSLNKILLQIFIFILTM